MQIDYIAGRSVRGADGDLRGVRFLITWLTLLPSGVPPLGPNVVRCTHLQVSGLHCVFRAGRACACKIASVVARWTGEDGA
jgi:hypothetical protein